MTFPCPFCRTESRVITPRLTTYAKGDTIKRLRRCPNPDCDARFTTYEIQVGEAHQHHEATRRERREEKHRAVTTKARLRAGSAPAPTIYRTIECPHCLDKGLLSSGVVKCTYRLPDAYWRRWQCRGPDAHPFYTATAYDSSSTTIERKLPSQKRNKSILEELLP